MGFFLRSLQVCFDRARSSRSAQCGFLLVAALGGWGQLLWSILGVRQLFKFWGQGRQGEVRRWLRTVGSDYCEAAGRLCSCPDSLVGFTSLLGLCSIVDGTMN